MNNIDSKNNIQSMSSPSVSNKAHVDIDKAVEMTKSAKTLAVNSNIRLNAGTTSGTIEGGQVIHNLGAVPKEILTQYKTLCDSQRIDDALPEIEENEKGEVSYKQNSEIEKKEESSNTIRNEDEDEDENSDSGFNSMSNYGEEEGTLNYGQEDEFIPQPIYLKEHCMNKDSDNPPFKAFGMMLQATYSDVERGHDGNEITYSQIGKGAFKTTDRVEIRVEDNKIYHLAISDFKIKGNNIKKGIDSKGIDLDNRDITNRTHELNMVNLIFSKRLENVIPGGTLLNKETGQATIVTKYCSEDTLDNAWSDASSIQKKSLLINMAVGKKALNDAGIVHGDFHGGNILVHKKKSQNLVAFVNDFGTAKEIDKPPPGIIQNLGLFSSYKKVRTTELLNESKGLKTEKEELQKSGKDDKEIVTKLKTLEDELTRIKNDPAEDSYALGLELCRLARKGNQEVEFNPNETAMFTWMDHKTPTKAPDDPIKTQEEIENFVNASFGNVSFGSDASETEKLKTLVMKLISYDPKDRPSNDMIIKMLEEIDLSEIERLWPSY
jgi:serine/threonine protein kinase